MEGNLEALGDKNPEKLAEAAQSAPEEQASSPEQPAQSPSRRIMREREMSFISLFSCPFPEKCGRSGKGPQDEGGGRLNFMGKEKTKQLWR